jgi:hypothetical protein
MQRNFVQSRAEERREIGGREEANDRKVSQEDVVAVARNRRMETDERQRYRGGRDDE